MQTIKLQLDDNLYENITKNGIDIKEKFKEFLMELVDDGYPAISATEAERRVKKALDELDKGNATMLSQESYKKEMKIFMETL